MKFSLNHKRAPMGNDISVSLTSEGSEQIKHVKIVLDNKTLANDALQPMESFYNRELYGQGFAGPGRNHILTVTVTESTNTYEVASHRWTDKS